MTNVRGFEEEKREATMAGVLQKQGRLRSKWLTRHYVVKNGVMFYYDDASDNTPKKVFPLEGCKAIVVASEGDNSKRGLIVQTIKRTHRLFANGEEEAQKWVDAILKAGKSTKLPPPTTIHTSADLNDPNLAGPTSPVLSEALRQPAKPLTHEDVMILTKEITSTAGKIEETYVLKEELGTGGFSIVRRGILRETGESWALKLVRNSVYQKNKERMEEEVGLLAAIDHPGVVKLKEVVHTPRYYCIAMELLTGGELFDRIVQREKYSENDAKKVAISVLEILSHMHAKNIVHRDLKPENLLFDKDGDDAKLKLTDFGFATVVEEGRPLTATCGTPEYVAPEILEEKSYGLEVDMWSAGVIIYILLCGFPPFYGDSEQELFEKICRAEFKFLSPYWNKISWEAKDLINNLLTLDPNERLTADEALQHKWLSSDRPDNSADLGGALDELKRFNATRKFRKTILAVLATNKMRVWAEMEHLDDEPSDDDEP